MDYAQLSLVADQFPWVFSEPLRHACGKDGKFGRRQRVITPLRLGLALTATCANQRVETIADVHGGFHALFGTTVTSKAFSHPVAKPHGADVARTMTERLVGDMTLQGLGFEKGRAVAAFRHLVRQDGSSCAIHDGLREGFPGRCKVVPPAAVEFHTTMDVRCDAPTTVVVSPDTTRAPACVPEPTSLRDGKRWRALRHTSLRTVHATRPKRQRVERVVQWQGDGHPLGRRLIISWNRRTKRFCSWLSPLPPRRSPLDTICRASPWRWQGARRCKAWKSYATLPAFDTENPAIVEGLMWTAMAAAALTRRLAPMTPLLVAVPMSTRKVAMGAMHVVGDLVEAWKSGDVAGLYAALEAAITSLACHVRRAHPERDRQTGRSQLGLEPFFENDDVIEFAEAA